MKLTNSKISEDLLDVGQNKNMTSSKIVKQDDNSMKEKESIILCSLRVKKKVKHLAKDPQSSPLTQHILRKAANNVEKKIPEITPDPHYRDCSDYAVYYNDPVEDTADTAEEVSGDVVKYRDYPMENGYIRI